MSKLLRKLAGDGEPDIYFQLINRSSLASDAELADAAAACQRQMREHVAPKWNVGETSVVELIASDGKPSDDAWWVTVVDEPDQAGALGYHDLTAAGKPQAKVFAKVCQEVGEAVSTTVSHEIAEMALDPEINRFAWLGRDLCVAYELSDAVQGDTYTIDGVEVSDFVLPSFFTRAGAGAPYDHMDLVTKPGETRQYGYQIALESGRMHQIHGSAGPREHSEPKPGSRRERRMRGQDNWRRSVWV